MGTVLAKSTTRTPPPITAKMIRIRRLKWGNIANKVILWDVLDILINMPVWKR